MAHLSQRGRWCGEDPNFLIQWNRKYSANPYHEVQNPKGIVNLGIAENALCEDIIQNKMNEPEMRAWTPSMQHYFPYQGDQSFREEIAKFMTVRFAAREAMDPERIFVTTGLDAAFDHLAQLLTDPGDCFLIPAPYYYAVKNNLLTRARVKCFPVQLPSKGVDAFKINVELLEDGFKRALEQGEKVKGIIILNPGNPIGDVLDMKTIEDILQFASRHELQVIMDEVYALSTFDEQTTFRSVLSCANIPDPTRTHVLWGFSKDFALSGLRCGVIYTGDSSILTGMTALLYLAAVPLCVQESLRLLLQDKEWIDNTYFPTNLSRMRSSFKLFKDRLEALGVPVLEAKASFFAWSDFSKYLHEQSTEGEFQLFKDFMDAGVYTIPGAAVYMDSPGWFRLTFTRPLTTLQTGLDRIEKILAERKKKKVPTATLR